MHALKAIEHGKHIVMVNVEADALAGPLLARKAKAAGVVYSLAWGDQPALICEHVDWARAAGFKVVAAGKGTRYEPHYHRSNPDNVWDILDKYLQHHRSPVDQSEDVQLVRRRHQVRHRDDRGVQRHRPACRRARAWAFRRRRASSSPRSASRRSAGGTLETAGVTEVTSSVYSRRPRRAAPSRARHLCGDRGRDRLRAAAASRNTPCCRTSSGRYAALYRPIHMIGLELGISVASAALRQEPTGAPTGFRSDVVATAKRDLKAGEMLDGEGGFCVWGKQTPAALSLARGLPAARARAERQAQARRQGGRAAEMVGRRLRPRRLRRARPPRDGSRVRAAECKLGRVLKNA